MNKLKLYEESKWNASEVAFIDKLSLESSDETLVRNSHLEIVFLCQERSLNYKWPDFSSRFYKMTVRFYNVSNFNTKFSNLDKVQISGFEINDIKTRGLENMNYEIGDYEDDSISFYCSKIAVVSEQSIE